MHGMLEAQHTHGHHLNHTRTPARGPSGTDGLLIKQQPERNYRCQLIEKFALFIEVRRLCPLIKPHYPRRTRYSPIWRSQRDRGEIPLRGVKFADASEIRRCRMKCACARGGVT